MNLWNPFERMKSKQEKNYLNTMYFKTLLNVCIQMFEYKNTPNNLFNDYIEQYLLCNGNCGIVEIKGELTPVIGGRCGEINSYSLGNNYTWACPDYSGTFEDDKDGVIIRNNSTESPDLDILQYAHLFTECDISIENNVTWSRLAPLMLAHDEKTKHALETAFENIKNGKPDTVVSENIIPELLQGNLTPPVLQLSDVKNIQNLQYLSEYRDQLLKRFFLKRGHSMQTTSKHAQTNNDEIHGLDSIAWVIPENMLLHRKKGIEKVNKLFGTNISVDFSEVWKTEKAEFEKVGEENEVDKNKRNTNTTGSDEESA